MASVHDELKQNQQQKGKRTMSDYLEIKHTSNIWVKKIWIKQNKNIACQNVI